MSVYRFTKYKYTKIGTPLRGGRTPKGWWDPEGVVGPRRGGGTPKGWWDPEGVVGPRRGGGTPKGWGDPEGVGGLKPVPEIDAAEPVTGRTGFVETLVGRVGIGKSYIDLIEDVVHTT